MGVLSQLGGGVVVVGEQLNRSTIIMSDRG
jgi:hypothetical protein